MQVTALKLRQFVPLLSLAVMMISCNQQQTGKGSTTDPEVLKKTVAETVAAQLIAMEKAKPTEAPAVRVCYVNMEKIFERIDSRGEAQKEVDEIVKRSNAKINEYSQPLNQLGEKIKKNQAAIKALAERAKNGEKVEAEMEKIRKEIVADAEKYKTDSEKLAVISKSLQAEADAATKIATQKIWDQCAGLVNAVAGKNGYDYCVNIGAKDAMGFPVVVAKISTTHEITERVIQLADGMPDSPKPTGTEPKSAVPDSNNTHEAKNEKLPEGAGLLSNPDQ